MPKKRGTQMVRSEIIAVRLDPRLRFACELAARVQRRALSSFLEWAANRTVHQEPFAPTVPTSPTVAQAADELWDADEADRFLKLAARCPQLLTHTEQMVWKRILDLARKKLGWGTDAQLAQFLLSPEGLRFREILRATWSKWEPVLLGKISLEQFERSEVIKLFDELVRVMLQIQDPHWRPEQLSSLFKDADLPPPPILDKFAAADQVRFMDERKPSEGEDGK